MGVNPKCTDDYAVSGAYKYHKIAHICWQTKVNTCSEKLFPYDCWPPVKFMTSRETQEYKHSSQAFRIYWHFFRQRNTCYINTSLSTRVQTFLPLLGIKNVKIQFLTMLYLAMGHWFECTYLKGLRTLNTGKLSCIYRLYQFRHFRDITVNIKMLEDPAKCAELLFDSQRRKAVFAQIYRRMRQFVWFLFFFRSKPCSKT